MVEEEKNLDKTIKQGAIGGLLGACIGVPGLGILGGVINANKHKIKKSFEELK
jgi:hypothetical protein